MIMSKIKQRIIGKGRGSIFTPTDFLDIGSRASVDQALSRLAGQGVIRRLTRGLYDYPKKSQRFGLLSPSADDIAKAIARKDNQILQPSPAMAANQLGLSTQVPSKPTYLTDGPTRTKTIGRQVIQFRNACSKTLVGAGQKTGAVFQALRYVGKDRIDDHVIDKLAQTLNNRDRALLSKQSKHVPAWMHPIVQQIVTQA
ncbi:type IV toxin-antitoxin system AbiEi family antitoxin domain-containing protein (plasmid) [Leisingera sp. M527]|uniref:type IV toxin-antitoxin system AbiEi family antitoxin domain-containing protein n=1 Tax=Leisingera sp. M527 TaxID=2867014 RepID=UPI0021A461D7|nr:type IV toxin-antitoxin system AbiEi family antitoxin domain-containing protein [Leisingera sp. M527]UWQ35398.1 type IV toxin-antitoxin system AbiEi family antitoxin domain-containing protein [Leisingera sp. M527]